MIRFAFLERLTRQQIECGISLEAQVTAPEGGVGRRCWEERTACEAERQQEHQYIGE